MDFEKILTITIPVFLVVAIGYICRLLQLVDDRSERSLMAIVVNLLFPCFILTKVLDNPTLTNTWIVSWAFGMGVAIIGLSFVVCYVGGRLIGLSADQGLNTFCVATAIQNYGFLPIPLILALFPEEQATSILGVLFVHIFGIEMTMWTVGITILSRALSKAWRRLINGPAVAIVLGLVLNYTGVHNWIPGAAMKTISMLSVCAIPIGLLLVGATLGGVVHQQGWRPSWRVSLSSIVIRFAVLPVMLLAAAYGISHSPELGLRELGLILAIHATMPTAIFPIVLSKHFGGHPEIAVEVSIVTAVSSLLLTPLMLKAIFSVWEIAV